MVEFIPIKISIHKIWIILLFQVIFSISPIISKNYFVFPFKNKKIGEILTQKEEDSIEPLELWINTMIPNNLFLDVKINSLNVELIGYLTFNSQYNYFGLDECIQLENMTEYGILSPISEITGVNLFKNIYQDYFYLKDKIEILPINKKEERIIVSSVDIVIPEDNNKKAKCIILGLEQNINHKESTRLLNFPLAIKSNLENTNKNFTTYLTVLYNSFLKENGTEKLENDGLMVVGALPHAIYPDKFKAHAYKEIDNFYFKKGNYGFFSSNQDLWSIHITSQFSNSKSKSRNKDYIGTFSVDVVPFLLPMELFNLYIEKNLDRFLKRRHCVQRGRPLSKKFVHTLYDDKRQTFIVFYCEKKKIGNLEKFYKNLSPFVLRSEELDKNFVFEPKELFVEDEDFTYLMMVPDLFNEGQIILGRLFMEKYLFTFNYDNNKIGFYHYNNGTSSIIKNEITHNNLKIDVIIYAFSFVLIIIFFGGALSGILELIRRNKNEIVKQKGEGEGEELIDITEPGNKS